MEALCDGMPAALARHAVSSISAEAMDCVAAVFLPDGRLLAQARSLPLLLGSLGPAVRGVLAAMAANPAYKIASVLDRSAIAKAGGDGEASFLVAMQPGTETGRDPAAPIAKPSVYKGMHGYVPWDPAMRSTLIVAGPGVAKGKDLGVVDMRAIAPSIDGAHVALIQGSPRLERRRKGSAGVVAGACAKCRTRTPACTSRAAPPTASGFGSATA